MKGNKQGEGCRPAGLSRRQLVTRGAALALSIPCARLLSGCQNYGEKQYQVDEESCTGCGNCRVICPHDAVDLPNRSLFRIDTDLCTSCGDCLESCEREAIRVWVIEVPFFEDRCLGCGECIEVCVDEGDAIEWAREHYAVNTSACNAPGCGMPCMYACSHDAISYSGGAAHINTNQCERCGDCVPACPWGYIIPAKVERDDDKCTNCAKCAEACEFDAFEERRPDDYQESYIDPAACNGCAECAEACEKLDAISGDQFTASLIQQHCEGLRCGLCVTVCEEEAIVVHEAPRRGGNDG